MGRLDRPPSAAPQRTADDDPVPTGRARTRRIWWTTAEFAAAVGMRTRDARRYLLRCDALRRRGGDGHWETSVSLLRRAFPDDWPEIVAKLRAS
jgi:hypothetical protein